MSENKNTVESTHPFHQVIGEHPDLSYLERQILCFSTYVGDAYDSEDGNYVIQHQDCDKVTIDFVKQTLQELDYNEEFGLTSMVLRGSEIHHIPMLDVGGCHDLTIAEPHFLDIAKYLDTPVHVYDSGQSYHVYGEKLLDPGQWQKYLGFLLLLENNFADSRWVGHSLKHGFSCLRWSFNTEYHQGMPKFVKTVKPTDVVTKAPKVKPEVKFTYLNPAREVAKFEMSDNQKEIPY